jgi:hypothetical protein
MIQTLFSIPAFKFQCENWQFKKQKILDIIKNNNNLKRSLTENFNSDRSNIRGEKTQLKTYFIEIFSYELDQFCKELGVNNVEVTDVWSVKYNLNDFQGPHNHRSYSYSGILYVDYEEHYHQPTIFVAPWNDPIQDGTLLNWVNGIKEGTMIFFPSFLLHYAPQNKVNMERIVVSFDLLVN